ncbi:MAG: PEGA domain-containing protein [Paludibacter sp.]
MKTFLTTTFLSLLIFSSFAQQINVKSFRMLESDQEARIISPKKDQNGKKAAIIKVVTSQTGFVFDFGMIGNALATEQKTGEIWVWVPAGARKVTINHQQLGVLRNYEFEIDIQEATVYEMKLTTDEIIQTVKKQDIVTQWVVITSEPSGADVYIDDKSTGLQTPYSKQWPIGTHTYRVSLDMFHPEAGKFELLPNIDKIKINSKLKPAFGQLKISTIPEDGATITLDGIPIPQSTPCILEKIKSGTHTLSVNKALYHESTQLVKITDSLTTALTIDLKPAFGSIFISSTPESGAAVSIDDVTTGKVTPCTVDKIKSGNHLISLRREGYAPIKKPITVNDGQKVSIDVVMSPLFGEVKINTSPEADIYIDNSNVATGTYTGRLNAGIYTIEARKPKHTSDIQKIQIATGETKTISFAPLPQLGNLEIESSPIDANITLNGINKGTTPTTLRNLLVGDYQITLNLPNYAKISKTITIVEGKTTSINETLSKGREITVNSIPHGANVVINAKEVGTTPLNYVVLNKQEVIELKKTGFETFKDILYFNGNDYTANLVPKKKAELKDPIFYLGVEITPKNSTDSAAFGIRTGFAGKTGPYLRVKWSSHSRFGAVGGFMYHLRPFILYGGAGWGKTITLNGLETDAGVILNTGTKGAGWGLSIGVSSVQFKHYEFTLGLGFTLF